MVEREPTVLDKFFSLFTGNENFYVKHQPPFTQAEDGKVTGSWVGISKERGTHEILKPTADRYRDHLNGGDGIAIEPLCADNTCFFSAIDIDVRDVNYTSLIQKLYKHGLKFGAFVSKSNALHLYFFYKDKEKGKAVIEAMNRVVHIFGLGRLYTSDKGKSKVEVFPKHAVLPPDSQGSCIFLPFWNIANPKECRQKMLTTEGKLVGIEKAMAAVDSMFTTLVELNETLDQLPYSDAPYCVQMLTLTGALAQGDGRNDFIYQAGIYLKKKQKENFLGEMLAINAELAEPQPEKDVEATYHSVMSKQMEYKCKTGPCAEFCDAKACKLREYGVGKDKQNHFTGFADWGEISRVLAEEPYYLWKVQVEEGGDYKEIRLDGEADLMNEFVVARACVRCVNKSPRIVKPNDWIDLVNQSLIGIENRNIKIEKSSDTTEMSAMRRFFIRYLTHKQIKNNGQSFLVQLGQVMKSEGFYYFTTEGFKDYLRVQKFVIGRINLREELIRFGASTGEVRYTVQSREKVISCWKKPDDEELVGSNTFYDDVLELDKEAVSGNKLGKIDESFDKDESKPEGTDGEYRF